MKLQFKKLRQILLWSGTFLVVTLFYNNCANHADGPSQDSASTGSSVTGVFSGDTCDQELKLLFAQGYHQFTTTNCNLCHVNGPGKGRFAAPDVEQAFADFMQIGYSKVSTNAVSATHNPPYSGPQHVQTINELRLEWQKGLESYNSCKGTPGAVDAPVDLKDILAFETAQKLVPVLTMSQTKAVEWNLATELTRIIGTDALPNLQGAKFSMTIGKYQTSGGEDFYTFSQPRIYNAGVDIHIKTLQIKVNGMLLPYPTTFRFVDTGIHQGSQSTMANSLISPGALTSPGVLSAQDKISVAIELIEPTTLPPEPPPVVVNFVNTGVQQINSTSGMQNIEVRLSAASTSPVVVSISSDNSPICSGQTGDLTNVKTCRADLATLLCPTGSCADYSVGRARSVVGTTYNRFDWDYKFQNISLTYMPGETSKTLQVQFSTDIRREADRLLTLSIDSGLVGANRGSQGSLDFFIRKSNNPVPAVGVPTYSSLMNNPNIFQRCLVCHNSVDLSGGYDITNYDLMLKNGVIIPGNIESKMYYRMNPNSPQYQNNNPMPLNGALDTPYRKEVEAWILSGALNN